MRPNVTQRGSDFGEKVGLDTRCLKVARDARDADDPTPAVEERDLVGQAPSLETSWIEVEFEVLADGDTRGDHPSVLLEKAIAEGGGKDAARGSAQQLGLVAPAAPLGQGLVDDHISAIPVLDEVHDVRHPIEKRLREGGLIDERLEFGIEFHHPIMPKMKFGLLNHTRPNHYFETSYVLRLMTGSAISAETAQLTGRVFNVQRCSVHDGPGIRTTVFLKGCPLACTWCHNPEGIDAAPELMISSNRCLSCRSCTEVCPVDEGGAAPAGEPWDREVCTRCGSCVEACPADARELAGREYAVAELVDVIERDRVFFDSSGGGVTFSGGEPIGQPEFLVASLSECRRRGLHTAVDTCGLAPRETLYEVADLADLVLFDLKHMDCDQHRAETGIGNRIILGNLRALSESDTEIWIRIPVIPGFNDDPENIAAMVAFLEGLPRRHRVCLLPCHNIADGKRSRLEDHAVRSGIQTPDAASLEIFAQQLMQRDLEVEVGGSP